MKANRILVELDIPQQFQMLTDHFFLTKECIETLLNKSFGGTLFDEIYAKIFEKFHNNPKEMHKLLTKEYSEHKFYPKLAIFIIQEIIQKR